MFNCSIPKQNISTEEKLRPMTWGYRSGFVALYKKIGVLYSAFDSCWFNMYTVLAVVKRLFWQLGCTLVALAIVERWMLWRVTLQLEVKFRGGSVIQLTNESENIFSLIQLQNQLQQLMGTYATYIQCIITSNCQLRHSGILIQCKARLLSLFSLQTGLWVQCPMRLSNR